MTTTPRHFISSADFSADEYKELLETSMYFMHNGISPDLARGKIAATLFFQPSTRTMNAFQAAMLRAGGGWIGVMGEKGLSMEKGESFEDTIREYANYADCIALRYGDDDAAQRAAAVSRVPVMNCGCGSGEHAVATPVLIVTLQAFLKRPLEGATIGFYGTPEINRVSKSLLPILGMFGCNVIVDDLGHFPFPKEIEEKAKANGLKSLTYGKLDSFLGDVDVLLVTRGLQKGIIPPDKFPKEKEEQILKLFQPINPDHMKKMRSDAILYMIKPLIFEVDRRVDSESARSLPLARAVY